MPELTKTQYEDDYISLKWGTFKSYKLSNPVFDPLIEEYNQLGTSMSAMAQRDTLRQKEIICEMIDIIGKDVYLDWDGEYVSPAEAKKYVMGYRL
jgi:hypothetical protein